MRRRIAYEGGLGGKGMTAAVRQDRPAADVGLLKGLRSRALDPFRRVIQIGLLTSLALNLLSLVTPVYFTQVYDRVLSSHSAPTLFAITAITIVVIGLQSVFDLVRTLVCARASVIFYAQMEQRVYAASRRSALAGGTGRRSRAFDDLETVRGFLAGPMPAALFDIVFVPLFVLVLFAMHPAIGVTSLVLVAGLALLAVARRSLLARTSSAATDGVRRSSDLIEAHLRSLEPSLAMGYAARIEARAATLGRETILGQMRVMAATGSVTTLVKGLRSASQILVIALAAWLTLEGAVSAGAIIACSILFSRALAPLDQIISQWQMLFQVRGAWDRLLALAREDGAAEAERMALPPISGAIAVEALDVAAPGGARLILQGLSFALEAGDGVGIVGPSGSGKSTLARALIGAWPPARGVVRLDGADLAQLDRETVGRYIGYLPQSVDLLPGTVAENIRRFGPDDPDGVIAAARDANLHETILALPNGYDTRVGEPGFALSGGQRQRLGLARALYGTPRLVVLDEPDTALDKDGELALMTAIASLRAAKSTVIVIAHRASMVAGLDKIIVMTDGRIKRIGKIGEIMPQILPVSEKAGA